MTDEIKTLEDAEALFASAYNDSVPHKPSAAIVAEVPKVEELKPTEVTTPEAVTTEVKPPEAVDTSAPVQAEAPKPTRNDIPDWAVALPAEVQDKIAGLNKYHEQKYRSDIGRQSAYQRQLREAQQRIADLAAKVNTPPQAAQPQEPHNAEEWNKISEADPTLAKAIESRLEAERIAHRNEVAALQQQFKATVDPLYQQSQNDYLDQQHKLLVEAVPNYQDVVNHPVYSYWINQKASPGIRQLANTSNDAQDAIAVFKTYGESAQATYDEMVSKGLIKAEPSAMVRETPTATVQTDNTALADKVAKSREEKIQTAAPIRQQANPISAPRINALSGGKPQDSIDINSPDVEALFAEVYNKSIRR